ncbi:hypothetical protein [Lysinibacillus sp. NPDC096212]|uniref:hypothetical protein n=1 Tax=Lysinibacillus sp. NPDC096212 TaxID=3364135 RepID=UPI003819D9C9
MIKVQNSLTEPFFLNISTFILEMILAKSCRAKIIEKNCGGIDMAVKQILLILDVLDQPKVGVTMNE